MVARPAGLPNTEPASPTSAAAAPFSPALRTEPGRCTTSGVTGGPCAAAVPAARSAAAARPAPRPLAMIVSANPDDVQAHGRGGRDRATSGRSERQGETRL